MSHRVKGKEKGPTFAGPRVALTNRAPPGWTELAARSVAVKCLECYFVVQMATGLQFTQKGTGNVIT